MLSHAEQRAITMIQKHGKQEAIERINANILTFKYAVEPEYQLKLIYWCKVLEYVEKLE